MRGGSSATLGVPEGPWTGWEMYVGGRSCVWSTGGCVGKGTEKLGGVEGWRKASAAVARKARLVWRRCWYLWAASSEL